MNLKYLNSIENHFIFNFWFAGLFVLFYFILKNFFEISIERLEWFLYIIAFLILIIYFCTIILFVVVFFFYSNY